MPEAANGVRTGLGEPSRVATGTTCGTIGVGGKGEVREDAGVFGTGVPAGRQPANAKTASTQVATKTLGMYLLVVTFILRHSFPRSSRPTVTTALRSSTQRCAGNKAPWPLGGRDE